MNTREGARDDGATTEETCGTSVVRPKADKVVLTRLKGGVLAGRALSVVCVVSAHSSSFCVAVIQYSTPPGLERGLAFADSSLFIAETQPLLVTSDRCWRATSGGAADRLSRDGGGGGRHVSGGSAKTTPLLATTRLLAKKNEKIRTLISNYDPANAVVPVVRSGLGNRAELAGDLVEDLGRQSGRLKDD